MKKVLFFDMYQTLVDTEIGDKKELVEKGYLKVFSNFLIENSVEESRAYDFQKNYQTLQDDFYSTRDKKTEHHDLQKLLKRTLAEFYTIDIDDTVLSNLIWKFRKETRGDTNLYEGVQATLETLSKTYTMFLASYTQASYSLQELEELGIKQYFKGYVFSSDIGYKKKDTRFYQKCIEVSGTEAVNCIMIGDNILDDVLMAQQNGMKAVWIKNPITVNGSTAVEIVPDKELELKDFSKLEDIIEMI